MVLTSPCVRGLAGKKSQSLPHREANRSRQMVQAGDLSAAEKNFQAALDIWRAMGSPDGVATARTNIGDTRMAFGGDRWRQERLPGVFGNFPQERREQQVGISPGRNG